MVGHRAADSRDGASIPDHRRHARARRQEGAAARHRFRGRDLSAAGARRHAHGHLRAGGRAVVARRPRRGISGRTCCRTIWSASRRVSRSASSISRRSSPRASSKVVNGPFTFAPDGNPLVGPMRGLRNFWVACGVMAGFSQGGGVGLALSRWMVDGDPGADVWGMDVARYGDWTTLAYTNAKVRENYSRRFRIRFPNEELPAARPLRTTPIYERLAGRARGVRRLLRARASRSGSRRAPQEAARRGELPALELASARGRRNAARCAMRWDFWRSPTTASSTCAGRAPPSGCRIRWRTASRPSGASR